MASLNVTQIFTHQPVVNDTPGFRAGLNVAIPIITLLFGVLYYVVNNKPFGAGNTSVKQLRNIPWKEGSAIVSSAAYHRDNCAFSLEGFAKFGSIFAFKFMTVCISGLFQLPTMILNILSIMSLQSRVLKQRRTFVPVVV